MIRRYVQILDKTIFSNTHFISCKSYANTLNTQLYIVNSKQNCLH